MVHWLGSTATGMCDQGGLKNDSIPYMEDSIRRDSDIRSFIEETAPQGTSDKRETNTTLDDQFRQHGQDGSRERDAEAG